MGLVFIFIGLVIVCHLSVWSFTKTNNTLVDILVFIGLLVSLTAIAILSLTLVVAHMSVGSEIAKYESVKMTIEQSREDMSEIERAALISKVIEINESIASNRYWNDTVFDWVVPDELAELEYLK